MATEEEERRRRLEEQAALAGLTPAYMEMLENQLARQRGEGDLDITPPLTKYEPLAEDRRSERTGLMRPVGNILDRLVRPGWQAEMNRRQHDLRGQRQAYAEQRPMQAAKQSALLTDSQLEALKQKALDGDEKAQQLLATYVRSLNPSRTGTSGMDASFWRAQAGAGGGEVDPVTGMTIRKKPARPSGDPPPGGDDTLVKPLTGVIGSRTVEENVDYIQNTIDSNNQKIAELRQSIESGEKTTRRAAKGGSYTTTSKMDWDDTEAARQRIRVLTDENTELGESLKDPRLSRPAAGSGQSGRAGEATIR